MHGHLAMHTLLACENPSPWFTGVTLYNSCDLHLLGANAKHRKTQILTKKPFILDKSTHFLATADLGATPRFLLTQFPPACQIWLQTPIKEPAPTLGQWGFYRFPTSFFHSFPQIPWILGLTAGNVFSGMAVAAWTGSCFTEWFFTDFWIVPGYKINAAPSLPVQFLSWRYSKLHPMQKKHINKSQRAWLYSVVWSVLNTERINI